MVLSVKYVGKIFPFGTPKNPNCSSLALSNNKNSTNTGSSVNLKRPPNRNLLFNQFNDLSLDSINKKPENKISCKYYENDDIQKN